MSRMPRWAAVTDDLARETKFQWMARLGFLVRGLLYIVIGLLVIGTGRTEDLTGAMEYLQRGFGRWLLILMVAGMTGYGLWRVSDAAFGMDSGRHHMKAWRRRVAAGVSGAIYLFLAYKALRIMLQGYSNSGDAHERVAAALHLPAGALLLAGAAAVLAGAGLVQLFKAGSCSFLKHLDERGRRPLAKWLGRVGFAARGVVFLTLAWLLARSALDHSAAEAGGLEQALDALRGPLEIPVAAGLLVFGLYSIVEARYRSIHQPPTEHIKRKVREAVPG
jgi:sulfite exporter TauE/SafE